MSLLVIGDIGRSDYYHLGDEAMMQVSLAELGRRAIRDVTLVASDPAKAEEIYGVPSIPKLGFTLNRHRNLAMLAEFVNGDIEHELYTSLASCDGVLISGGGNLNSFFIDEVFQRLAIARVAKRFGKPLVVTSQTVGPMMQFDDFQLVQEIIDSSSVFGAREAFTKNLLRRHKNVAHTMDDAFALPLKQPDGLPERFIVGSFSASPLLSHWSHDEYKKLLIKSLDTLVEKFGLEVLLVPHLAGYKSVAEYDDDFHQSLVDGSLSGGLIRIPLIAADEYMGMLSKALFSVSNRYHPSVMAPAMGTPAISLIGSEYDRIRNTGALRNVGLNGLAVPIESLVIDGIAEIAGGVLDANDMIREHLGEIVPTRLKSHIAWWDSIEMALRGEVVETDDLPSARMFEVASASKARIARTDQVMQSVSSSIIDATYIKQKLSDSNDVAVSLKDLTDKQSELIKNLNLSAHESELAISTLKSRVNDLESLLKESESENLKQAEVHRTIISELIGQINSALMHLNLHANPAPTGEPNSEVTLVLEALIDEYDRSRTNFERLKLILEASYAESDRLRVRNRQLEKRITKLNSRRSVRYANRLNRLLRR